MSDLMIREVELKDLAEVVELCKLHAEFEGADYVAAGKQEKLRRAFFDEPPSALCFVAENKGKIVGYATATREFSTWDADYYLHMDCLYILQEMRGIGLGGKFINTMKHVAKKLSCSHIQWQTPIDNNEAIQFYLKQNARYKNKKRFFLEI